MDVIELFPTASSRHLRATQVCLNGMQEGPVIDPRIAAIELSQVRRKLMAPVPEGKGWTLEQTISAEKWYRRFLHLVLKYPTSRPVPSPIIDAFWHQHILDTQAYARDSHAAFGRFVHHNPYFGMNGDSDERDDCFADTNRLFKLEFGEAVPSIEALGADCNAPCTACTSP